MTFTGTAVAALALVVAVTVMWRHKWEGSRFTVICMLVAGFGITGSGWVGEAFSRGGELIGGAVGAGTSQLFGVSVPLVVVAFMVVWLVVDMKDSTIHKATPWMALALPTVLAVVGGVYTGMGDTALATIGELLEAGVSWLGSLG